MAVGTDQRKHRRKVGQCIRSLGTWNIATTETSRKIAKSAFSHGKHDTVDHSQRTLNLWRGGVAASISHQLDRRRFISLLRMSSHIGTQ